MPDNEHNIFDDDNAFDYIMQEEVENNWQPPPGNKSGCLGLIVLIVTPPTIGLGIYLI
ncbi:MAG: hypothetical protein KQH59_03600 [Desulfobulbaceae bacterium]|nr:hypothetical protein [Desulfobulbaceae bacterium]